MKYSETILKAMVANLMDHHIGSTKGWTEAREVKLLVNNLCISPEMARAILTVCDEVRETKNYDPI